MHYLDALLYNIINKLMHFFKNNLNFSSLGESRTRLELDDSTRRDQSSYDIISLT